MWTEIVWRVRKNYLIFKCDWFYFRSLAFRKWRIRKTIILFFIHIVIEGKRGKKKRRNLIHTTNYAHCNWGGGFHFHCWSWFLLLKEKNPHTSVSLGFSSFFSDENDTCFQSQILNLLDSDITNCGKILLTQYNKRLETFSRTRRKELKTAQIQ